MGTILLSISINSFTGLAVGFFTFLIIGLFHPLVIKAEYYIGVKSWWLFFLLGLIAAAVSLFLKNQVLSILCGVVAFSSFWSIIEVFHQRARVRKGWFPANHHHHHHFFKKRKKSVDNAQTDQK